MSACLTARLDAQTWTKVPGCARDIGVGRDAFTGRDGIVGIVGGSEAGPGGWSIHRWTGSEWERVEGAGVRIAVGTYGNPWLVNRDGAIYERSKADWVKRPGCARDIGASSAGEYIIGCTPNRAGDPGGGAIYSWNLSSWSESRYGAGTRIAVDRGAVWLVNAQGGVFWNGQASEWTKLPGCAKDIAVDGVGTAWIIGCSPAPGGWSIHRWTGASWERVEGGGVAIAAGRGNAVWVVNAQGDIFRGALGATVPSSVLPATFSIEIESLLGTAQTKRADQPMRQVMASFGPGWGEDAQLFWPAAQLHAELRLEPWIFLPEPGGQYEVLLTYTKAPDYGEFAVYPDTVYAHTKKLASVNAWAPTVTRDVVSLGVWNLHGGPITLRFDVDGKVAESKGYLVGLDRLESRRQP